ncbi:hypothetical protein EV715DRAFT_259036, partial [Schizophyllum commune]
MSHIDPQESRQHLDVLNDGSSDAGSSVDERTPEQQKADKDLANRLSQLIENANEKLIPLCKMIRKHIENMDAQKEEDRSEPELVKQVKPLLEQATKILDETNGQIKGADPDGRLANRAKRHQQDHRATPEEQRLAEALKVLVEEVGGTIEWAREKLEHYPKAKKDLGPLLDALGPTTHPDRRRCRHPARRRAEPRGPPAQRPRPRQLVQGHRCCDRLGQDLQQPRARKVAELEV